jgi:hypothetical protein
MPLSLPLFKVLVDHKACSGGDYEYPPIGEWTPAVDPVMCNSGYHLTSDPLVWWKPRAKVFLAEGLGCPKTTHKNDKAVFRSVRLLEEVTRETPNVLAYPRLVAFLVASMRSLDSTVDITWADLSRANLSRADLRGAILYGADLSGANLSGADLSRADLSRANLSRADLSGANLYGADLSGANLFGANLSRANLFRANLFGANLSRANLSGANLFGANLSRANLSRANLSGANLSGADLSWAISDKPLPGWSLDPITNRLSRST